MEYISKLEEAILDIYINDYNITRYIEISVNFLLYDGMEENLILSIKKMPLEVVLNRLLSIDSTINIKPSFDSYYIYTKRKFTQREKEEISMYAFIKDSYIGRRSVFYHSFHRLQRNITKDLSDHQLKFYINLTNHIFIRHTRIESRISVGFFFELDWNSSTSGTVKTVLYY